MDIEPASLVAKRIESEKVRPVAGKQHGSPVEHVAPDATRRSKDGRHRRREPPSPDPDGSAAVIEKEEQHILDVTV